ncbi:MAG: SRPBCC family protein, partial [Burkholderiales bacterium]
MKKIITTFFAAALALPIAAVAEDSKTLNVAEKVEINAPADLVWSKVKNFGDLGAWHPAVAKTEIIKGKNKVKGAVRLLTLQDGGTIKEKLIFYNEKGMTIKYQILEGVLPVSSYVSWITVKGSKTGATTVVWKSTFMRMDTSANPAEGQDDAAAVKTITNVYKAGLDNLKKISEAATGIE